MVVQAEEQAEVTKVINLTPIPKQIQERLKEKMSVIGRERQISPNQIADKGGLKLEEMMTRTTFIRMTSGQSNPVILMGGKLDDNLQMPEGYSEIYGPRSYSKRETGPKGELILKNSKGNFYYNTKNSKGENIANVVSENPNKSIIFPNTLLRPTPGIKSIDVAFKGGLKTNREATISWTCWSWDEIEYLTPHFLAHGKNVLLEWGWVYDKNTLQNLPNFLAQDPNGGPGDIKIDSSVYENYQRKVVENNGDFDLMAGIIKNFEYTTREDGAFDCTTTLTSIGINLIKREGGGEASGQLTDPSRVYNLDLRDEKKVEQYFTDSENLEKIETNEVITINTTLTLKAFMSEFDRYVFETFFPRGEKTAKGYPFGNTTVKADIFGTSSRRKRTAVVFSETNKTIVETSFQGTKGGGIHSIDINNVWVRWGWFEDNILPKFLSLTSADPTRPIISKLRSIERVLDEKLNEFNPPKYESVRIRNSDSLETVDINSYILPGQFFPTKSRTVKVNGESITIDGDEDYLNQIKSFSNKFKPFAADEGVQATTRFFGENEEGTTIPAPGRYGFLRNMLINTKIIKSAFGVDLTNKNALVSSEPINILESIERMFRSINQAGNLNLWNFALQEDEKDSSLIKIIDNGTTYFDFSNVPDHRTIFTNNEIVGKPGVFYFPVWQSDSIVKRQNLTTKIPTAIQLATMYGSNTNPIQEMENHATTFDATGVAAGAFNNKNQDSTLKNLNIAIKNNGDSPNSINIGRKDGDENEPLDLKGGEDILTFIQNNTLDTLETIYKKQAEDVIEKIEKEAENKANEEFKKLFDNSKPIPSLDFLSDEDLKSLFDLNYTDDAVRKDDEAAKNRLIILKDFARQFGEKFKDGQIRSKFLSFINERIIGFGTSRNEETPILIPFELELDIDGIGGIYPANSFHSSYLPSVYQDTTIFQAKDVNHKIDAAGWTTTIAGVMRTTLDAVFKGDGKYKDFKTNYLNNYIGKIKQLLSGEEKRAAEQIKLVESFEKKKQSEKIFDRIDGAFGLFMVTKVNKIINFFHRPKKVEANIDGE